MLPEIITDVPGPRSLELAARLKAHESRNVTFTGADFPVFWERASGTNVWDVDGNRYLDLTSAFAVGGLGHGNAEVVGALKAQADLLVHGMGDVHPTEAKVALCEKLSALTFERWGVGAGKTLLGCSGFEAVEAAMKTAFLATGKRGVLTFEGGYHGLGYGTLMAGSLSRFRAPFLEQLGDLSRVASFPDEQADIEKCVAEIERALAAGDVGAIIVEPILGRGGKVVPHREFLPSLREIATARGAMLIFDEIYTGLNRTGRFFGCDHWRVVPDIICLGKGLASGYPISACVGRVEIMDAWPESDGEALHTSTFLGNPIGCRMALASLEQHAREGTADQVRKTGELFASKLGELGVVRGRGLMLGLEVESGAVAGEVITRGLKDGLILLADGPDGRVLAIAPPFEISAEEIDYTCARLQEYLMSLPGSSS